MDTRDVLRYTVDLVSYNLIQLTQLVDSLEEYTIDNINVIDLKRDSGIYEKLASTIDLRLKIVEVLSHADKYIREAIGKGDLEDSIRSLRALASFYIYAGVKRDRRVHAKYRHLFNVPELERSIEELNRAFTRLLKIIGDDF